MNDIIQLLDKYDASKAKKQRKKPYRKPESVKQFEAEYKTFYYQDKNMPIDWQVKPNFRDDTSNGLTKCICSWLKMKNHFSARINTTGTYNAKLKRFVYSGSTKGMADITAVINGKHISIEVKIGKDKPRAEQLKIQQQIEQAGGKYVFVRSFEDFLEQINEFIKH